MGTGTVRHSPGTGIAKIAAFISVLALSLVAGCNTGFDVLTLKDYQYVPVAKCAVFEPTLACDTPAPDASVCGHQPLIFTDATPGETYHQVSLDNENWIQAVSGVTTFADIPGFAALPCGAEFTFYMKGEDLCNNIEVGVVKQGITLTITAPASGALVCGHNIISFTDSDTLETIHQVSIDNTNWVTATSGTTRFASITGFSAITLESTFTLYVRGTDACNHAEVSCEKRGVTVSITSPASGATVCGYNTISFTDSDTQAPVLRQVSVNGSDWVTATSGSTRFWDITGFISEISNGAGFTLYLRGNVTYDPDNITSIPLTKSVETVSITSPTAGAVLFGDETITFTDSVTTTYRVSINLTNWTPAVSDTTKISDIPGFTALANSALFTIYLQDVGDYCNTARVSVTKAGGGAFNYSRTIRLDTTAVTGAGVSTDVNNFPVLIRITDANIIDFVRPDLSDIRFQATNGTWLDYEIERWNFDLDQAEIWVRVPVVHGSSTADLFYMYFGEEVTGSIPDGQNPAGVFSASYGFAGVWHMGDTPTGSADDIADSASNDIDGTSSGMGVSDQVAGQVGGSLNFDGTNNYISLGTSSSLQPANITVSFWIKRPSGISWSGVNRMVLYAKPAGGWLDTDGWCFGIFDATTDPDRCAYVAVDGGSSITNSFYSPYDPDGYYAENSWVFMTVTFDSGTNAFGIYKNSVKEILYGSENPPPESITGTGDTKLIGQESGYYWQGVMDELRISNVVRPADWIKLSYENQKNPDSLVTILP